MSRIVPRRQSASHRALWQTLVTLPWCLLCLIGCSDEAKMYPVNGKVQWKGGAAAPELANYTVSLQSNDRTSSATAVVQPDGSFTVSTLAENDGAAPGKYRVALTPPEPEIDRPVPRPILPGRYGDFETSGLEIEVKPEPNSVTVEVDRK